MAKFWKYIQHVVIVVLIIELGCFIVGKVFSKEESISSFGTCFAYSKR